MERRWHLSRDGGDYVLQGDVDRTVVPGIGLDEFGAAIRGWSDDPQQREALVEAYEALTGQRPDVLDPAAMQSVVARVEWALRDGTLDLRRGAALDIGSLPGAQVEPVEPTIPGLPVETRPRIISVAWLDGADDVEVGSATQWVNLPREAKWVDGDKVASIDRLTRKPRIKVHFDRPGAHHFKLKLQPGPHNVVYTGAEEGRNANYLWQKTESDYTTAGDGTKIIPTDDFFVTAAGANVVTAMGTDDDGNVARSAGLTSMKMVFYPTIKMASVTNIPGDVSVMTGEYERVGIKMVALDEQSMPLMKNVDIDAGDLTTLKANARTAYLASQGPSKEPHAIALVWIKMLASMDAAQVVTSEDVAVGPGLSPVQLTMRDAGGRMHPLWIDLDARDWFVSAQFIPADGGAAVNIPKARCTPIGASANAARHNWVEVDVDALPDTRGRIRLTVNWLGGSYNGVSLGAGNVICIATVARWDNRNLAEMVQTLIHEFGHQFNMVADGTGTQPDKVSTHYVDRDHMGPHCHHNLPLMDHFGGQPGDCVLFGESSAGRLPNYCENCTPAIRKMDLSAGFSRF